MLLTLLDCNLGEVLSFAHTVTYHQVNLVRSNDKDSYHVPYLGIELELHLVRGALIL